VETVYYDIWSEKGSQHSKQGSAMCTQNAIRTLLRACVIRTCALPLYNSTHISSVIKYKHIVGQGSFIAGKLVVQINTYYAIIL
jgi:hypothetical protein